MLICIGKFTNWGEQSEEAGKNGIQSFIDSVINLIKELPSKILEWLLSAAQQVVSWGADMISKVSELLKKMASISRGESIIETPEEFAFAAGQLVSYLIDRSVASNKTYSMLEPYLQKTKSGHLQDAIANTVSIYKHDISTYKGAFQQLASNVLTCDENLDMKPLLKYFLAGCFSKCVIYIKNDND